MTEREKMVRDEIAELLVPYMPRDYAQLRTGTILNITDSNGNKLLGIIGEWKDKPDSEGWWWFRYLNTHWHHEHYQVAIYWVDNEGTIFNGGKRQIPAILRARFGEGKWSKAVIPK